MVLRSPTVRDDGSGSAVLIKHAAGTERLRLRHEAQVLAAARTDGVVECVGLDEFDDRCELRLPYLEAASLAELPPLVPSDALDVLIDLGATLAELHARGIRHGALRADHVLLIRPRRPVLCGFGDATGPDDQSQHLPSTDLAALAALASSELRRADRSTAEALEHRFIADALAACESLAAAAAIAPGDGEPLSTWLARMQHIRDTAGLDLPRVSDGFGPARPLAAAAALDPNGLRERLRAEASADGPSVDIASGLPGAERRLASPPDRRRIASYAVMAATLAIAAFIGWRALASTGPPTDSPSALPHTPAAPIPATSATSPNAMPAGPGDPSMAAGNDPLSPTMLVDDPDTPPTSVTDGATLLYSTAAVRSPDGDSPVESPGDLVAIGDWDCDGHPTPAIVSPNTGIVSFYDSQPSTEHPVEPERTAHVPQHATAVSTTKPPPDTLEDETSHPTCDALVIHYGALHLTLPQQAPPPGQAQMP